MSNHLWFWDVFRRVQKWIIGLKWTKHSVKDYFLEKTLQEYFSKLPWVLFSKKNNK